jgi:hypothetical protein
MSPDSGDEGRRHRDIHASNGQKPLDGWVFEPALGDFAIE